MRTATIDPPMWVSKRGQTLQHRSWLMALCLCVVCSDVLIAQPVVYVDADATGALHDGSTWCEAFLHLQDAFAAAAASDGTITEVRIAAGVYKPDQGAGQASGDRMASFRLINGVAVYGGYAGCGEPDPSHRDPRLNETILSGDLSGNDDEEPAGDTPGVCCYEDTYWGCDDVDCLARLCNYYPDCCSEDWSTECRHHAHSLCCYCQDISTAHCENSLHVVGGENVDSTAILDGLTITAGHANGYPDSLLDSGSYVRYMLGFARFEQGDAKCLTIEAKCRCRP